MITADLNIFILIIIFIVSLTGLVKGADYLLEGAERVGKFFKLSPFVIGALIVGVGTSLPELASSAFSILRDEAEIVVANVIGSNIANILLVAGLAAVIGKVIYTSKNLLKLEIPLLVISTSLFLFVSYDGVITFIEAFIMFFAFIVYLAYLLNINKFQTSEDKEELAESKKEEMEARIKEEEVKEISKKEIILLIGGIILLALGANYLIESIRAISGQLNIATSVISVLALAVGTSLPEILVSVKAVLSGRTDLAFGNVFGSNVFNILMLTGILGMFSNLPVSPVMISIGLPFLAITTLIFYVSATAKRIYIWEGLMFLAFYSLFVLKIIETAL